MNLGILAPMPEEIDKIISAMTDIKTTEVGMRSFHEGNLLGLDCVVALSRIGKVASAVTAAILIEKFKVSRLIVIGVAGAVNQDLKVGDIVIASECVQHDLDASPLFPPFEAPLLNQGFFKCDANLISISTKACKKLIESNFKNHIKKFIIDKFGLDQVKIHNGLLCCGDQFISSNQQLNEIRKKLPNALCVEMEGGAVGQVCYENNVQYVVIRNISDSADHNASVDFNEYLNNVSANYCYAIIENIIIELKNQ